VLLGDAGHALGKEVGRGLKAGGPPGVEIGSGKSVIGGTVGEANGALAEGAWAVLGVTIAKRCRPRPPAAALRAAWQRTDGVEKVMAWVGSARGTAAARCMRQVTGQRTPSA
jgi:hypothetical protein